MNKNILLIEPDYKNKYPPIGLMKIAFFHKYKQHDNVRFAKGKLPESYPETKWDHIYVTSLFTFEWDKTIEAIKYAISLAASPNDITVGGIAATLLPDEIFNETGIHPICGLLNTPGKLGIPGDENIDQLIPDYDILNNIEEQYTYPVQNAYFLSATKGCGMRCGFCAVQTLEPAYVQYIDIKHQITEINQRFGEKKDLLLMDNNVLRSGCFDKIIQDIIDAGFEHGALFKNPKTGKMIRRYVDFNQGLDGNLLTDHKAKLLGTIALKPARIAFDHIEDAEAYRCAIERCVRHGVTELSNYILYNSDNFSGKGKRYKADSPDDLYKRMRISLDLKEELNKNRTNKNRVAIFSFPMRYIPLTDIQRGYVGPQWNAKYLRAVQCMLIPTQGKGVGNKSFFEADFGKDCTDFLRFLCMPERLIALRGHFSETSRGHKQDTHKQIEDRKINWQHGQIKIAEWNRLFNMLGCSKEQFINVIADNKFLPQKILMISVPIIMKLYIHYLTLPRIFELLGLELKKDTKQILRQYTKNEFPSFYDEMLTYLVSNEKQPTYPFRNFISFFGKCGFSDILKRIRLRNCYIIEPMAKWNECCQEKGYSSIDFELLRYYTLFKQAGVLSDEDLVIVEHQDTSILKQILKNTFVAFSSKVYNCYEADDISLIGKKNPESFLSQVRKKIFTI